MTDVGTLIEVLRKELPEERHDTDGTPLHPGFCIAWEQGEGWEVEYCVLDSARNVVITRPNLLDALLAVAEYAGVPLEDA